MSRSVSAPSSVTKTSPCWNGLIVPGSTLRYGSNFWSWTRRPRSFRSRPSDAATIPLPRADTTPPVTKTYFGARALTGFQGSRARGQRSAAVWTRSYRRPSACLPTVLAGPNRKRPSTATVTVVRSAPAACSWTMTPRRSLGSSKENSSFGATARTRRTRSVSGRRRKLGPCTCQRAPAAIPRRSGSTPEIPGHQSDRWYGSARKPQTSPTGASRTRSATYRGKELLASEHPFELGLALRVVEKVDPRVRRVACDLLHPEVTVGDGGDLREMRDRDHLRPLGEAAEDAADGVGRLPADAGVDLVEHEGLAARDGRDRERDARQLAAGRRLGDRPERHARVRPDEEHRLVRSRDSRLALAQLAHELAVAHADVVQLGGDRLGERGGGRDALGAQPIRQLLDVRLRRLDRGGRAGDRIGAPVERGELLARGLGAFQQLLVRRRAEPPLRLGDPIEARLELLEQAGLRFERREERVQARRRLPQA